MGSNGLDIFISCRQHEDASSVSNNQPQRGVIGEHFEGKCRRNTGRWTAERSKEVEGSCNGLQQPENLVLLFFSLLFGRVNFCGDWN